MIFIGSILGVKQMSGPGVLKNNIIHIPAISSSASKSDCIEDLKDLAIKDHGDDWDWQVSVKEVSLEEITKIVLYEDKWRCAEAGGEGEGWE